MAKVIKNYAQLSQNDAYELMYEEYLDEIKTAGIVLRHKKSGARVCLLSNDDDNKVFCTAFRTPAEDSTGVPHIIEHTVLNGSEHFPARDLFMHLIKGSLNTFLNAFTEFDMTLYPVASCNDQDFKNLMHVYMDTMFYPNIYKYRQIFMQEGWHYELDSPEDELKINGIVYSEMKGAMSSPERALHEELSHELMPDTTYGVNDGGDPDVIPTLTYEKYLDFHRRYYHPSNSYIFVYGDCDMDERLSFMDENYLSHFDAIDPDSDIKPQPHWGERKVRVIEKKYPVSSDGEVDGKAYLSYASLAGSNLNTLECRAYSILSNVLINSDSAPVKKALIKAGIGEDVSGGFWQFMIEDAFVVTAKNAKAEDAERFLKIMTDTLREEVEHGINEKALLACINRKEFNFREANFDGEPRGLDYIMSMLRSWLYDENAAFSYLHPLSDLEQLKKLIGTGYFEGLIRKYILESDHAIMLKYIPERGLLDKIEAERKQKLADYKASLTDEEINKIIDDTRLLREYQSRETTAEEEECIPSLERSDISLDTIPLYNEERTVGGCKTVYHDLDTNGIVYASLTFDIGKIPHKYVPYITLLSYVLSRIDTEKHTYEELNIDIKLNTGSIDFEPKTVRLTGTMDDYRPLYELGISVMPDKVAYAFDTAYEIITESKFDDKERLRAIIAEIKSDKQREIMDNGHSFTTARAASYFSRCECYVQQLDGLDFYYFIKDIYDNFDEKSDEIVENLRKCTEYIFDPSRIIMSLAARDDGYRAVEEELPKFTEKLARLPHRSLGEQEEYVPVNKNEGIMIPSQVQYVGRAANLNIAGLKYSGALSVVRNAVNADYLYQQVRVKGGAYGCGCSFNSSSGSLKFYSYRDPGLKETDAVYCAAGEYIRNAPLDEKTLTKYIIGTFSSYDSPLSPYGRAVRSFNAYLSGKTYDDIVREREEMLGITIEEFRSAADVFDKLIEQRNVCVIGNENKLKDNADMFSTLLSL